MGERLVFHVDVNSAFLSWEAARRGVVLAKSIPAKAFKGKQASERSEE